MTLAHRMWRVFVAATLVLTSAHDAPRNALALLLWFIVASDAVFSFALEALREERYTDAKWLGRISAAMRWVPVTVTSVVGGLM